MATLGIIGGVYFVLPSLIGPEGSQATSTEGAGSFLSGVYFYPHGVQNWIIDQVNRWALAAPSAGLLLLGFRSRNTSRTTTLFLAFACLLAAPYFLWDTEGSRGSALDADSTAVAGLVCLMLALCLWKNRIPGKWARPAMITAVLTAGSYILMHADSSATVARVTNLADYPTLSTQTRGLMWETLGLYHRSRKDTTEAISAYRNAIDWQTGNHRLIRNTAVLASLNNQHRLSADTYRRLMDTGSMSSLDWTRFGSELWMAGSRDSAVAATRQAIMLADNNVQALNSLAQMLVAPPILHERLDEAEKLLERSLSLDPDQPGIRSALQQIRDLK